MIGFLLVALLFQRRKVNALQSGSTSSRFYGHGFTSTHCVIELEYVSGHVQGPAVI